MKIHSNCLSTHSIVSLSVKTRIHPSVTSKKKSIFVRFIIDIYNKYISYHKKKIIIIKKR